MAAVTKSTGMIKSSHCGLDPQSSCNNLVTKFITITIVKRYLY